MKIGIKTALDSIKISLKYAPIYYICIVTFTIFSAVIAGPILVLINKSIFDNGLLVAKGEMDFMTYIPWLIILIVVKVLASVVESFNNSFLKPRYLFLIKVNIRKMIVDKCMRMKYRYFEDPTVIETIDHVYNRADVALRMIALNNIPQCINSIINIICISIFVIQGAWWMPITTIAPIIIFNIVFFKKIGSTYKALDRQWQSKKASDILTPYMSRREYIKEVYVFGAFKFIKNIYLERLKKYNRDYEKVYMDNMGKLIPIYIFLDLSKAANIFVLLLCLKNNSISIGLFISLSMYIFNISLILPFGTFKMWSNYFSHYYKLLALEEDVDGNIDILPKRLNIEFKDVWFKYPGAKDYTLKGISFFINDGDKISLVGQNGAGKTTIIKLLLGLYDPEKGEILLDGKKITEYSIELRSKIFSTVFQDFNKYDFTLKENIAVGNIELLEDEAEILKSAEKGGVLSLLNKLGQDQILGREFEGGVDISGGEWQKVALSRAFMGNKPIMLLDEPTSQLDPMTESNLYKQFLEMAKNKTTLLVSHRLGSTKITERILVLSEGVVKEEGNHDFLIKTNGIYASMFNAQKEWYEEERSQEKGDVVNG